MYHLEALKCTHMTGANVCKKKVSNASGLAASRITQGIDIKLKQEESNTHNSNYQVVNITQARMLSL